MMVNLFSIVSTDKNTGVVPKVIQGGIKIGVNLPNTKISLPAMTEKICRCTFAIGQNVDWIAIICKTPKKKTFKI
jgi:pyruvate kinase